MAAPKTHRRRAGFTLIELLVVMCIIALLLAVAVPRYFHSVARAREAVLKENLTLIRDALDKHYSDTGAYPPNMETLVTKKYLRKLPEDPLTESATTWVVIPPDKSEKGGVFDVRSGAPGNSLAGEPYAAW
ncbi:prepilin-type N-terminal cleavage/methylation domain-containing protein [Ramlibacter monticola]|uniref:Prepilin-type N-terminal cleavage/methylation domain-containing protein n=1 Tax=Ramlibacter monticola TaxID=1926872 RepID=A0A936Z1L7_9BURK|nr:prepilin-type N-terminal cleavage/methylation domain-containing protein [Ramlibacter monticola]MBL0392998.1 prepilin-type N-terminal cleavage/methylation domain-containing protein [Ramlibacter monticola]